MLSVGVRASTRSLVASALLLATVLTPNGSPVSAAPPIYPVVVDQSTDELLRNLSIPADAANRGMWSRLMDWPIVSIHAGVMPDGRVVTFGSPTGNGVQDGRTYVYWDPDRGTASDTRVVGPSAQGVDSFCASGVFLNDGRMLISGGAGASGFSSRESLLLEPTASSSVRDSNLIEPRWYGTMTKLPDGRAIMTGGGVPYASGEPDQPGVTGQHSETPEIYTPGQGWRMLPGGFSTDAFGATNGRWWYPRQWVSPNGTLFGISTEKVWELDWRGSGSVRTLRDFKTPANNTTRPNVGPTSTAVMYDIGRILQVGGNGYYNNWPTQSSAAATIFDINGLGAGRVDVIETRPMNNPRQ